MNKRQYAIPVYQRNYEWSREQCVKLFQDIVLAYKRDKTHFCGSVVYAPIGDEHHISHYVIVDGQQRLTTIYLLIKALLDKASTDKERESLREVLFNHDKFDEYAIDTASKLKLKPIKSDNNQLNLLMEGKISKIDKSSGIWKNYSIFCEEIDNLLAEDDSMDVKKIYKGIEELTCAMIKLDGEDNAQEIFERINSTGVPLSLADKIRNYVLMTDQNQEILYEKYWLNIENLVKKEQRTAFFLDYLNIKIEGFVREDDAYEVFKKVYQEGKYTNEGMLDEINHYAFWFHSFIYGNSDFSQEVNRCLAGLRQINQSTLYLFLYRVFDDFESGVFNEEELEKILRFFLAYSVRRIICEISSNSLRGLYKTLYNRVFIKKENKDHYYDAIVSFMNQLTSRDVVPNNDEFIYALCNNNLYGKHALCMYILCGIENSGKEKVKTDNLTVEHIMPQNKNLSTAWQKMLGDEWESDRNRWLHTLGNLTLTGYNSELGDRPFDEKKSLIEEKSSKIVTLYSDVKNADVWNADKIQERAKRLSGIVKRMFEIEQPKEKITFNDPNYQFYTSEEPACARYKVPSYYELLGERVNINNFADMMRSVAAKLYELDNSVIVKMATDNELVPGWNQIAFSYDESVIKKPVKLKGTDISITSGYSATDIMYFIRELLKKYDLDLTTDFVYCARTSKLDDDN